MKNLGCLPCLALLGLDLDQDAEFVGPVVTVDVARARWYDATAAWNALVSVPAAQAERASFSTARNLWLENLSTNPNVDARAAFDAAIKWLTRAEQLRPQIDTAANAAVLEKAIQSQVAYSQKNGWTPDAQAQVTNLAQQYKAITGNEIAINKQTGIVTTKPGSKITWGLLIALGAAAVAVVLLFGGTSKR